MTDLIENAVKITELCEKVEFLTDWERQFVKSIESQLNNGRKLSKNQVSVIERVHGLYDTSVEWAKEYKEKYEEDVKILAEYYCNANGGVYFKAIQNVLKFPDFIPNKSIVEKTINNQYAKRVLRSAKTAWRFNEGDTALIRCTINPNTLRSGNGDRVYGYFKDDIIEKPVFIISRNDVSPEQWHVYKCVLLTEPTKELWIQERWLKGMNRKVKKKPLK
jgi:hypothetical protein